jgi:hypothetical protein
MKERTIRIPDDQGNFVEVKATDVSRKDLKKAEEGLEKARGDDFFIRVGTCTDALNKFLKAYVVDYGLTLEESISAVYLLNINNREFAPEDAVNWQTFYDGVCKYVWDWFVKNKE